MVVGEVCTRPTYRAYTGGGRGFGPNKLNAPGPANIMVLLIIPIIKIVSSQRLANDWYLLGSEAPTAGSVLKNPQVWGAGSAGRGAFSGISDQPKVQPNYRRFPWRICRGWSVWHANLLIGMKTSLGAIGIKNKYISRVGRRVCAHVCVCVCVIIAELKRNKEFNYNALFVTRL